MSNSGLTEYVKKKHMKQLADYRDKELRPKSELRSFFLEITPFCNEHCLHCGSRCGDIDVKDMLSKEEIFRLFDEVYENFHSDRLQLCITGGEPLLRPEFFEIMAYARDLGFEWGMTTNGTLITREVAEKLKECKMGTVSVSVDGIGEKHDWFRSSKGSYEKTMEGIKNLVDVGFDHVQITTVIHHSNIDSLDEMYEVVKKTGVRSWRVINIEPIGRAKDNPELMLTKDEYKKLFDFIEKNRFADKTEVCYGCSHYLGVERERELRKWYFLCNAGVYTASVMYNGDVGACLDIERRPETIQGNIRERSFTDIWKNEFKIFRTDYRKCGKCKKCKEYKYCAGDSYHTWDFDKMEPRFCHKDIE